MWVGAELTCYHCGRVAGQLPVDLTGQPHSVATCLVMAAPGYSGALPRCPRCRGPLYADPVGLGDWTGWERLRPAHEAG